MVFWMSRILISICSAGGKPRPCLESIRKYCANAPADLPMAMTVAYNAPSIYAGHQSNLLACNLSDRDIVVMCHDDVEILGHHQEFHRLLQLALLDGVGFLGVAGATHLDEKATWWNARNIGAARGFVFQGEDNLFRLPNDFGPQGQVVVLDGCFLACSYATLKSVGWEKPDYLSSDWDFYDIHLTSQAHLRGLRNYTIPLLIRHESNGEMRPGWSTSRDEFVRFHRGKLPMTIPFRETHGFPGRWQS